jgi:hypothetical protein
MIFIVLNNFSIKKFKFSTWPTVTLFYTSKVEMHWVQVITNETTPYTLITIHNLHDMNKFLYIYQSPYYLSVDNAFSVLHIQNVYIYSKEIRRLVITSNNVPVVE